MSGWGDPKSDPMQDMKDNLAQSKKDSQGPDAPYFNLVRSSKDLPDNPLTFEKLKADFDYYKSDEYHQLQRERAIREVNSQRLVQAAYQQGIITEMQMYMLLARIDQNGYIILNPEWAKKLENVEFEEVR